MAIEMQSRRERRIPQIVAVQIRGNDGLAVPEVAFTENVSRHGARVQTKRRWQEGQELDLASIAGNLKAHARVVYCRPLPSQDYVTGLELRDATGHWLIHTHAELQDPSVHPGT